jgi:hypothetical protein
MKSNAQMKLQAISISPRLCLLIFRRDEYPVGELVQDGCALLFQIACRVDEILDIQLGFLLLLHVFPQSDVQGFEAVLPALVLSLLIARHAFSL